MSTLLPLDPDQLLSTTRAVRRRLDLDRPVPREVVEDCLRLGLQAPTSSNQQDWQFVVVTDRDVRAGLAELYRRSVARYYGVDEITEQGVGSDQFLALHLQNVPVHLIPCIPGRTDSQPVTEQAA
ncbi:MAG: nitroreductase family protein, partial [Mycobacteriales bacterium]